MGRPFTGVCQQAHPVRLASGHSPHLTIIYDVFIPFFYSCLDVYFKTEEMKGYSCEGGVGWSLYNWQSHSFSLRKTTNIWFSLLTPPPGPLTLPACTRLGQLLKGTQGKRDHFSHPPLGRVFILADESKKFSLSKFGCQKLGPEIFESDVMHYAFL